MVGDRTARPLLVVVIPAHNESARLASVLDALPRAMQGVGGVLVCVVDDGSTDNTAAVATAGGALVARHPVNLGLGAALRTGCDVASRLGADLIVTLDADGQHPPDKISALIEPILSGMSDVVLGQRAFDTRMPVAMRLGNRALNGITWAVSGLRVRDSQCGFRAFTVGAYRQIRWQALDYTVSSEIVVRIGRARLRLSEVSIPTIYLDHYKGTEPIDGLRIFAQLVATRLGGAA